MSGTRKTTLEIQCEKYGGSFYNEKDKVMEICLQKGLGYIDRTNDPLGLTFDKSQERPHRFFFIVRGDYEILGWVVMKYGELRASGIDVKKTDDGFIWKGKKFGEGVYYLVRFNSGREVLFSENELRRLH